MKDCLNRLKRKNKVLTSNDESDKKVREVDGCMAIMIALWEAYDDSHHVERAIKTFVLHQLRGIRRSASKNVEVTRNLKMRFLTP